MKKNALIVLIFLIFFGSCKKNFNIDQVIPTSVSSTEKPTISNVIIAKWFANNPAGAFLNPDWTNAKQTVINGEPVVSVPLLSITMPTQQSGLKVQSIKSLSDAPLLSGFNSKHPPALYF